MRARNTGPGFPNADFQQREGERVRVLKRLDVHEVSPVLRGVGIDTGTLSMKLRGSFADRIDAVMAELDDIVERADGIKALRRSEGRGMSTARVEQMAALKQRLDKFLAAGPASMKQPLVDLLIFIVIVAAGFLGTEEGQNASRIKRPDHGRDRRDH